MFVQRIATGLALALAMTLSQACVAQDRPITPVSLAHIQWLGPYRNVKVETGDCNGKLCGWVVWATPEAEEEAREGGVQHLVGTELLQDYRQVSNNRWQGRVFVPDMGRTFYSTITRIDPGSLKISGCILGGLVCKSQIWKRV